MIITKAFEIIEKFSDQADFCGSVEMQKIINAQQMLKVKFPRSYILFLEKYGAGDIFGIEIFGIIKDSEIDASSIPNGIWLTSFLRKEIGLPKEYVVVGETGSGEYYVIDTVSQDEFNESPILIVYLNKKVEKVADSFGEFLYQILDEQI